MKNAYNIEYGARPVKRFLQSHVETELGKLIIEGKVAEKDTALLDLDENNQLKFKIK